MIIINLASSNRDFPHRKNASPHSSAVSPYFAALQMNKWGENYRNCNNTYSKILWYLVQLAAPNTRWYYINFSINISLNVFCYADSQHAAGFLEDIDGRNYISHHQMPFARADQLFSLLHNVTGAARREDVLIKRFHIQGLVHRSTKKVCGIHTYVSAAAVDEHGFSSALRESKNKSLSETINFIADLVEFMYNRKRWRRLIVVSVSWLLAS